MEICQPLLLGEAAVDGQQPPRGAAPRPPHRRGQPFPIARCCLQQSRTTFSHFDHFFLINIFSLALAQHQPPFWTPLQPQGPAKRRGGWSCLRRGAGDAEQSRGVQSSCHGTGAEPGAGLSPPCLCLPRAPLGTPVASPQHPLGVPSVSPRHLEKQGLCPCEAPGLNPAPMAEGLRTVFDAWVM